MTQRVSVSWYTNTNNFNEDLVPGEWVQLPGGDEFVTQTDLWKLFNKI